MIFNIIAKVFGTTNDRIIKKIRKEVELITKLESEIQKLSDEELKKKAVDFRIRLAKGETVDQIRNEVFAVVREVSIRIMGMRHFDVQLIGGIVLNGGMIAEMKTGEGKTLVATLSVVLNALRLSDRWVERAKKEWGENPENWTFEAFDINTPVGRGVHVVTVNDYLASRDANWMSPIYNFMGLKVGTVLTTSRHNDRVEAYNADITYGTNNEFGFDYLRDNMVTRIEERVQRELHYGIIDEVDSILIDEARTPLIISGPTNDATDKYGIVNSIIPNFNKSKEVEVTRTPDGKIIEPSGDFWIDEKGKSVYLTSHGIRKAESLLNLENLYADINADWVHHLTQALRAHYLFENEVDYVVNNGKVEIVDEFTGRILDGRRWSDGLHQAIEAKEGVKIANENQTLATITFQNYFKMYEKMSGMTGTAETEAIELKQIYNVNVVVIPTNKDIKRDDRPDMIFPTEKGKYIALARDIKKIHEQGHPILIGTVSIENSEKISYELKKAGIKHNVLNAKQHMREADVIAQAGKKGAVTIATNMAGRGTDIVLGGNAEITVLSKYEHIPESQRDNEAIAKEIEELKAEYALVGAEIKNNHGLYVIGTERHESRRIDNQLRGRSGRQGDSGVTQFYVSLEDNLMRIFGNDTLKKAMLRYSESESEALSHPLISKSIEKAQKRVEGYHFESRKHLLEYDNVMNIQREVIYNIRKKVLEGEDVRGEIFERIEDIISNKVFEFFGERMDYPETWPLEEFNLEIKNLFLFDPNITFDDVKDIPKKEEIMDWIIELVVKDITSQYEEKEKSFPSEYIRQVERMLLLQVLDQKWKEQLRIIDQLREGVNLRGYAQKDPLVEFKRDALGLFSKMLETISESVIGFLFRLEKIEVKSSRPETNVEDLETNIEEFEETPQFGEPTKKEEIVKKAEPIVSSSTPKPNDPCSCGSGKKYKKCCGAK